MSKLLLFGRGSVVDALAAVCNHQYCSALVLGIVPLAYRYPCLQLSFLFSPISDYSADNKLLKLVCRAKGRMSTMKPISPIAFGFYICPILATPVKAIFQVHLALLDVYIEIDSSVSVKTNVFIMRLYMEFSVGLGYSAHICTNCSSRIVGKDNKDMRGSRILRLFNMKG